MLSRGCVKDTANGGGVQVCNSEKRRRLPSVEVPFTRTLSVNSGWSQGVLPNIGGQVDESKEEVVGEDTRENNKEREGLRLGGDVNASNSTTNIKPDSTLLNQGLHGTKKHEAANDSTTPTSLAGLLLTPTVPVGVEVMMPYSKARDTIKQ